MANQDLSPPPVTGEVALPNGNMLYWKVDEATGCREYMSDEVGGGVQVWHTALVDDSTLLAAIVQEKAFQKLEYVIAERKRIKVDDLSPNDKAELGKFEQFLALRAKTDQEIYDQVYGKIVEENETLNTSASIVQSD